MNTRDYHSLLADLTAKDRKIEYLLDVIEQYATVAEAATAETAKLRSKAKGLTATRPRKAKAETPTPALTTEDPTRVPDTMPSPAEEPKTQPAIGEPQTDGPGEVTSLEGGRRRRFGL